MHVSPGASPVKSAIWDAARTLFAQKGYARTTVRDIAAAAGTDPSLVIRHFGSKETLFLAAMVVDLDLRAVLDSPAPQLGERLIAFLLDADAQVRETFLALLRASDSDGIHTQLHQAHERQFVRPLAERLSGPDAGLRARVAASVIGGMLYSLWIVRDEELAALGRAELVRRYGALIRAALDD